MVSLLQDQARITFPSLDPPESNPCGDRMQASEESASPARQERPEGRGRTDGNPPASPPCPERLFARFPAEKFRRSAYPEGGPRGGRFAKGAPRSPFHPYQRRAPEEPFPAAAREESFAPPLPHLGPEPAWSSNGMQYGRLGQEPPVPRALEADARLQTAPLEEQPFCCQPHGPPEFCPSHPFHQYLANGALPLPFISAPHHPYQRMGLPGPQQPPPPPPLFPKPIYSYSILIFMALKNSKTGSLPVSEIYNFMTEHFPYFKTAPDGWKNSVRHNLSLNKCFEKVENKAGSSSRKGCLWALNPAKVDKMQEELQKWKRKDPVAVRKSMAKPEELEILIGDKSEKPLSCSPASAGGPSISGQMPLQPLPLYAQNGQGALPSPLPAQSPPGCGIKMLAASRPELLLLDGDLSMDVDALNPSITGFDLQGTLWEALKDDSLATEPLGLISASPTAAQPDFLAPCPADANHGGEKLPQHHNLPDVQLTTLYSAFLELDTGPAPTYLNPSGSKPIALV